MLDTDRLSNQTRSGNADGSSSESDTAQGCVPDDVDALEFSVNRLVIIIKMDT